MEKSLNVMLVAGEPSGDGHAAKLVKALREAAADVDLEFFGAAGPKMREVGVEPVVRADDLAIMGIPEIARALPKFIKAFNNLKKAAREKKPDVVVLIDFPEFNLKLAKSLKRNNFKVVYYISPQLWGWRKYRRTTIDKHVDLLLTILPFEKTWYERHGITNVEYVGSPLVNEVRSSCSRDEFRQKYSIGRDRTLIALLPGSRHKEITRILPPMLEAASLMARQDESLFFVIALASTRRETEVTEAIAAVRANGVEPPKNLVIVRNETYDAVNAADAAAVASGTATLETGIIGTPMAIVYKTSGLNYKLIRPLIKIDHFGLINLIAEKRIVKEMIQNDFTPAALAEELSRLILPEVNSAVRDDLRRATSKLGKGGASQRAAEAILQIANRKT